MVLADCSSLIFSQTAEGLLDVAYANAHSGRYTDIRDGELQHERHASGSNVLFADGHVRGLTPQRLYAEVPLLE